MTDCRVIRASAAEYSAMAEIWQICFGDAPSYVQFFFRRRLPSCIALTAQMKGKTAGAVYLLPAALYDSGVRRRAYYVYALGVLPEYRGRGIAAAMMRHIFDICKEQDAVCFLKPATPALADYYERLGMIQTHFAAPIRYTASADTPLPWQPMPAADFAALYLTEPLSPGSVLWDGDAVRYAVDENSLCGGFCLRCDVGGKVCAVLGRREEYLLRIAACIGADPASVLPALCRQMEAGEAVLRVPCPAADSDAIPGIMTYNMNTPASGPCGLLLD